ncbi:tRNA (adenosine(37)-N6)-threonylcarbamoyltransferase complex dimerization subunit type 1 TsaB [Nitrosomonas sp. wSCUT-2]
MKLLAIETSTEFCSVALLSNNGIIAKELQAGQQHSEMLLDMIQELLSTANSNLRQMDGIAFGAGPGSFTGLRIACGVAQGLAYAANLPIVGINTLEALAQKTAAPFAVVALDARMGEIYHAAYQKISDSHWKIISSPMLCSPEDAPLLPGNEWVACGSGFDVYHQKLSTFYCDTIQQIHRGFHPHAAEIAQLARYQFGEGIRWHPADASPVYIRNKVALTERERKV